MELAEKERRTTPSLGCYLSGALSIIQLLVWTDVAARAGGCGKVGLGAWQGGGPGASLDLFLQHAVPPIWDGRFPRLPSGSGESPLSWEPGTL